jgi:hypothetical protein
MEMMIELPSQTENNAYCAHNTKLQCKCRNESYPELNDNGPTILLEVSKATSFKNTGGTVRPYLEGLNTT